jgi:hypothetical protein
VQNATQIAEVAAKVFSHDSKIRQMPGFCVPDPMRIRRTSGFSNRYPQQSQVRLLLSVNAIKAAVDHLAAAAGASSTLLHQVSRQLEIAIPWETDKRGKQIQDDGASVGRDPDSDLSRNNAGSDNCGIRPLRNSTNGQ